MLKRDPANTAPAEEAFLTAIAIAQQQKARSFELRAALSLAKLYHSTGRAADAHAVLAPALEGFSPTPEFPEIEEAQALLAALAETDEVKNAAASRQRRLQLQTSYGQALLWSKGFGAEETKTAFLRAQDLAAGVDNADERFKIFYGLWVGNLSRGEFAVGRETAEVFRRQAENAARTTEAVVGGRMLGLNCLWQGDFTQSQANLVQALRMYDPQRDREAKFRFGMDSGACATAYLAHTSWQFGEIERARALIDEAVARAVESGHAPTSAQVYQFKALLGVFRGDANAALQAAETVVGLGQEHGLAIALGWGTPCLCWARARLGERDTGLTALTQAVAVYTDTYKLFLPLFQGLLAELEAGAEDTDGALTRIDAAVALAGETGEHWTDAFLHRIRGEILLKRDPAITAPAEEAFLTAIAVAQQQKARSFELRAALALAKLYQSTNRPAAAHAVLAHVLEGFSPTPEFPEIEEAQTLLVALTETDQVKNSAASRQRRLKLQTSFGNALIAARGHGAPETTAAFARARELAAAVDDPMERLSAIYGLWVGNLSRGEVGPLRAIAEVVLRDIEGKPPSPEAAVAHRLAGVTEWYLGNFELARAHLGQTLAMFNPQRDRDLTYRFGQDMGVSAMVFMALALWPLGETDHARRIGEEMLTRAVASGHMLTTVFGHFQYAVLHVARRDAATTAPLAEAVVKLAREHGMPLYSAYGEFLHPWARWHLGDRDGGLAAMRRGIAACHDQGNVVFTTLFETALAEAEAEAGEIEAALASIDRAVALTERTGQRWNEADTHRVRGEILLKCDPANTVPAEEAFLTAIAVAQQQKARSFELRAAHSLAKLYQSTTRAADAHAVLAPALEGFSPTPEFPEIAAAQRLLGCLGS